MRLIFVLLNLLLCPSAWAVISCTIVTPDMDFGFYDHLDISPLDAGSNITVDCHDNVLLIGGGGTINYSISMDTGSSGSYSPRQMNSGSDSLNYNLYTDAARSIVWGDGTGGSATRNNSVNVPGCLSLFILNCPSVIANEPVYGRIPAQQSLDAGSYSDSILVTITY